MRFVRIYSFEQDQTRIDAMQKASLGTNNFGVSSLPALVGTPEWWLATQDGLLARTIVSGTISRVYWGSMGDWPECEVTSDDGAKSTWTREGDISRYVEGLRAQIVYVLHPWKTSDQEVRLPGGSKIVLTIEIEESDRRSTRARPVPVASDSAGTSRKPPVASFATSIDQQISSGSALPSLSPTAVTTVTKGAAKSLILRAGAPYGNRTRVSAVKGRRPRPLDEGRAATKRGSDGAGDIKWFAAASKQAGQGLQYGPRRCVSCGRYQCPTLGIDVQGSFGGRGAPFCNSSIE
jgi:hypothetical protein